MIKELWNNYKRYINVSKKESIFALSFGIIGAFSETFSIYLLANLLTNIENNKKISTLYLIKYSRIIWNKN